jgi:hypothetical protein
MLPSAIRRRSILVIRAACSYIEDLARDQVYGFAFIGGSLKRRGGDAAPLRPIAIALR